MQSLPSSFLVVNHEGLHRCYLSIEQVADFNQLIAKFSQHKILLVKYLSMHPNGPVHLGIHTKVASPILILEALQGKMALSTQYQLIKRKEEEWLSPCFILAENSFELRCEFDFELWAAAGLRIFFAINCLEHALQCWSWYKGQVYRAPFANVFETGSICVGGGREQHQDYFDVPFSGLDKLMAHLSASVWNQDAFSSGWIEPISRLIRFDPKTLKMLEPVDPAYLAKLPVMGHQTIAEVTKLLYG